MKKLILNSLLMAFLLAFTLTSLMGQEKEIKVVANTFSYDKGELDEETKALLAKHDIDIDLMSKEGGTTVKMITVDKDGNKKELNWNGEGEIPSEIQNQLDEAGADIDIRLFDVDADGMEGENVFVHKVINDNKAFLGVIGENVEEGVLITEVVENSAAAKAGIQEGDIINKVDGKKLETIEQLIELLSDKKIDDQINVGILRDGRKMNFTPSLQKNDKRSYKVMTMECDMSKCSKEDMAACLKKCDLSKCTKEQIAACLKNCDPSKCTKEQMEACKKMCEEGKSKFNEDGEVVMPRNTLNLRNFKGFPNPTSGLINIEFESSTKPVIIQIMDMQGKTIFKEVINEFDGKYSSQLDLSQQGPGYAILTVIQNEKIYSEKIIIQ